MLKELKAIGEYVMEKSSPVESFIHKPGGDFYIINLIYNGKTFMFDEIPKQGDTSELIDMCFKPGKATAKSLLPSGYISLDKKGEISGLHKIIGSLEQLSTTFDWCKDIIKDINAANNVINLSHITQLLTTIPKKDQNKKMVMVTCGLQLTRSYVLSLGLHPLKDKNNVHFCEIQEFQEYFLSKNQGAGAICKKGFCHICEIQKNNIIDFTKSNGVNFDYKFYNLDKPGFAYGIDKNNGTKSFGICQDCYTTIKTGYTYFKTHLGKNILGSRAYVFPSFPYPSEQSKKVFEIIEKYSNIDELDENIQYKVKQGEITKDVFDLTLSYANTEEKNILHQNFIKLNILFGQIDGAKSDELKVKYFLTDIVPSRLGKLYGSVKFFNRKFDPVNNKVLMHAKMFFGNTERSRNQYDFLPDLYIYPTYEKGKYCFNLKNFLGIKSNSDESYYNFLNLFLHDGQYPPGEFWSLIYKKIIDDFCHVYLIEKQGNLKKSLREIYLVYQYLLHNKLLSPLELSMPFTFSTDHVGLLAIQNYAHQHNLSQDAIYIALVGMYFKLCVAKQKKEVGTSPLITEINFTRMDYDHISKLLNKARDKFNKYSAKKFTYYPAIYKQILQLGLNIKKNISRDEMAFYFGLGMEILPDIYFTATQPQAANTTSQIELEEATTLDEII